MEQKENPLVFKKIETNASALKTLPYHGSCIKNKKTNKKTIKNRKTIHNTWPCPSAAKEAKPTNVHNWHLCAFQGNASNNSNSNSKT